MTLGKVAKHAGVAIDTARKVLRDDPSVRPYIRERVLKSVRELDYHPNLVARALRGSKLQLVSISVLELGEFYYGELASQISRRLVEMGFEPALCFSASHLIRMSQSLSTTASILVAGSDSDTVRDLSELQKVVTIDSHLPPMPSVGNVGIDFHTIYRHVAESVMRYGRRRIAVVSGHYLRCIKRGWPLQKFPPFFDVLDSAGLDTVGGSHHHVFGSAGEMTAFLISHPGAIDAVVCENDLEASRVVGELAVHGLTTPKDVLVVGCDANCKLAGTWSVKLDTREIASRAVSVLKQLLNEETPAEADEYTPELLDELDRPIPLSKNPRS